MTYLPSVAYIHKSKAALLVAVFVLCASLASWPQIAQANQQVSNPLTAGPVDRATAKLEGAQPAALSGSVPQSNQGPIVIKEFKHDTGPLLREIAPLLPEFSTPSEHEIENNVNPNHNWSNQVQKDPVLQTEESSPRLETPNYSLEFDGAGVGDAFFCNCMPPDNDGAVGTTQYVQYINLEYQVFDKSGNTVLGPLAGNAFWSGFGGSCQTDNSGDPIVRFDAAAQRWVVSQFAINGTSPDYECVAVSTTSDATGSYNRYAFPFTNFPDYPKMGVWPDAYYFTFNNFNIAGTAYVGADVCAADRTKMLAGAVATMQCFQQSSSHFGMLPSDLDGATPPAAGTPNFVMELNPSGSANLDLFKFHVDFVTPANSTFTGPTLIPVAAFTPLCNTQVRGACVPQPTGGSDLLESIGDRLMWRLVYRNFGDHTTLLTTHSIVAGSSGGIRWYEIRNPETSPTVFQSGTFAPDSQYRWMPAIAMDQNQDIAVGFSRSGSAAGQYPSIVYAGRVPTDSAGTLESEVVLKAGLGSQTSGYNRWGDYSSVTIDPTDDCTFWFTEEYEKVTGGFNWSTAIGTFSFPGCTAGTAPTITNLSPPSGPVGTPVTITGTNFGTTKGTSTVTFNGTTATTITSWSAISIATAVPAGATTGNVVVTVGGVASNGSLFTVSVVPTIVWAQPAPITYGTTLSGILDASAVDGSNPVAGSFAYTATPQGGSPSAVTDATVLGAGSYTLTANFTPTDTLDYTSASGSVSLTVGKATPTDALGTSAAEVLARTTVTFTATVSSPVSTPSGSVRFYDGATLLGSATLAQGVATYATSSLTVGNHSITAAYLGDSNFVAVTSSPVTETVEDFTVTVPTGDPTSATVSPGGTATYTVNVAPSNAQTFLSAITLSLSGAPAGSTATFTPSSLGAGAGGQDVALKVQVSSQTAPIHSSGLLLKLSPVMAGMLLLPLGGKIRRVAGKHRRAVRLLLLFLAMTSVAGITACGSHSSSSGNGPQTYTLTVAGTSGADSHSTTLTLTVQ
ncbi:MAG: Ig-like domain repeat protein [Terriglobales bacterium]